MNDDLEWVHPRADTDGIVRDGDCRETYFQMKMERAEPIEIMRVFWHKFNRMYFDGVLVEPNLGVPEDLDAEGRWADEEDGDRLLLICPQAFQWYERLRDVLLHEMCHQAQREVDKDTGPAHNEVFLKWARHCGVHIDDYLNRVLE